MIKTIILFLFIGICSTNAQEINKKDTQGERHGKWQGLYPNSTIIRYEGTFEHGKEVGIFYYYDKLPEKTLLATREFDPKTNTVYCIYYDKKNKVSEGNLKNKERDGEWIYYHKQAPKIMTREYYIDGKLEGSRKVYYLNETLAEETTYHNGIKEGPYKKYSEKGILLEQTNYKAGAYDGDTFYYNANGEMLSKGTYKNGRRIGIWQTFENNKLVKEENLNQTKKTKQEPK